MLHQHHHYILPIALTLQEANGKLLADICMRVAASDYGPPKGAHQPVMLARRDLLMLALADGDLAARHQKALACQRLWQGELRKELLRAHGSHASDAAGLQLHSDGHAATTPFPRGALTIHGCAEAAQLAAP